MHRPPPWPPASQKKSHQPPARVGLLPRPVNFLLYIGLRVNYNFHKDYFTL